MVRRDAVNIPAMIQLLWPGKIARDNNQTIALWYTFLADYPLVMVKDAILIFHRLEKSRVPAIWDICMICESLKENPKYVDDVTEEAGWEMVLGAVKRKSDDHFRTEFKALPMIVQWSIGNSDNLEKLRKKKTDLEKARYKFGLMFRRLRREEARAGEIAKSKRRNLALMVLEKRLDDAALFSAWELPQCNE